MLAGRSEGPSSWLGGAAAVTGSRGSSSFDRNSLPEDSHDVFPIQEGFRLWKSRFSRLSVSALRREAALPARTRFVFPYFLHFLRNNYFETVSSDIYTLWSIILVWRSFLDDGEMFFCQTERVGRWPGGGPARRSGCFSTQISYFSIWWLWEALRRKEFSW